MNRCSLIFASSLLATVASTAQNPASIRIVSPVGAVQVLVSLGARGIPTYAVRYRETEVLRPSRLGLQLMDTDLTQNLMLKDAEKEEPVTDDYMVATDKRAQCRYRANRRVIRFAGPQGPTMSVVFQVSNDGVAFQYLLEGDSKELQKLILEGATTTPAPLSNTNLGVHTYGPQVGTDDIRLLLRFAQLRAGQVEPALKCKLRQSIVAALASADPVLAHQLVSKPFAELLQPASFLADYASRRGWQVGPGALPLPAPPLALC